MRSTLFLVPAFLLAGSLCLAQTTLHVPGTYPTIQDAVNASTHPLDVVQVAAGTYPNVVNVSKPLTIKGPNAGIAGNGARGAEAIVSDAKITVSGANTVVIDGLKIYQTNNTNEAILLGGTSIATVQNCIIERFGVTTGNTVRGLTTSAGAGAKLIQNNLFTGDVSGGLFSGHKTWNSGIYLNAAASTVDVKNNRFQNCRTAINIDDFNNGITISGNSFENNGTHLAFGGVSPTNGQYVLAPNAFGNPGDAIINLSNVDPAFRLDITSSTLNGLAFSSYPLNNLFQIEAGMYHRGRASRKGLVTYVANNQYVIPLNPSVQAAINYGVAGNIIHVAPGTYTENLDVNKKVNILGSGSGSDPAANTLLTQTSAGAGDTRVGVIQLNASGSVGDPILLKDIRVLPNGMAGISVGKFTQQLGVNVSYISLDNVHVYGTYHENPCTEQERGLYVDLTSSLSNVTISNCAFNGLDYGWYLQKKVSADASTVTMVQVTNTEFKDNVSKGLYAEKLDRATFDGCTVQNNGDAAWGSTLCVQFKAFLAGFDINLKAGTYQDITIRNSVFTGNATGQAKEGVALAIKARDDGATYGPFPATLSNVLIENNLITGNERGIRAGEPDKNNATPTGLVIRNNAIYGNNKSYTGTDGTAYGNIINMTTAPVAGTCNWFGSDQPATIAMGISGNVSYIPFLQNGNDGSAAMGFQPTAACITPTPCQFTYVCFQQGPTHDGSSVPANRSNPELAQVAQMNDVNGTINFFSLGYGGFIVLKSNCPVKDGEGNDIKVWETTYGAQPVNAYSDRARVYASQDGVNYLLLGTATYDGAFDLASVGLSWAQYFRISDATVDFATNSPKADAYDLDGIEVLNGYTENADPDPVSLGGAASVCGGVQGKNKNFSNVLPLRSDPTKATGLPNSGDKNNFYTLGFGGDICLKFDFAIFDGPGDELKVIETTFGNLSCSEYPEKAEISVSFNGTDWNVLGTYCQDYEGGIDIGAANSGIQYVRIKDISNRADFTSPAADGYDLDAVVALSSYTGTPICNFEQGSRKAIQPLFDQTEVPNEILPLTAMEETTGSLKVNFTMPSETAQVVVRNYAGQTIQTISLSGNIWDVKDLSLPSNGWAKGLYFITVESPVQKETIRVIR